jgi:plastocyanin
MAAKASKTNKGKGPASKPQAASPQAAGMSGTARWVVIGLLILVVAFGAYRAITAGGSSGASGSSSAGAQITGPATEAAAVVSGGVQRINVEVANNVYSPNVIKLKAGVPAQLTFGQSQGCTAVVMSQDLGFREDLTSGPKTVDLKPLQPGTYSFSCGMKMVFGKVIVE